jgi:hypothetical protein
MRTGHQSRAKNLNTKAGQDKPGPRRFRRQQRQGRQNKPPACQK